MALLPNENRILAFEYVLKKLIAWQSQSQCFPNNQNDISTLKAVKLLFFVSAVNSNKSSTNYLLRDVFKDFVAMPYGHVESVIYDAIRLRGGKLNYYIINTACTIPLPDKNQEELEQVVVEKTRIEINIAVERLRQINSRLVCMSAFDLVELSHAWYSWQKNYSLAREEGGNSRSISAEDIIAEDKIFNLHAI